MKVLQASVVAAAAVAVTANSDVPDVVGNFHRDGMPTAWKNAKAVLAPENPNLMDRISRTLSHWMGFNKGNVSLWPLHSLILNASIPSGKLVAILVNA